MKANNEIFILLTLAVVSAILNYAGFSQIVGNTWWLKSLSALTSIAVFAVIYGFWAFAFEAIPALKKPRHRALAWLTAIVGCFGIIAISAYWNLVALAGTELKTLALRNTAVVAEQQLAEASEASGTYQVLPPQILALSNSVGAMARGEEQSGSISGSPGKGGISKTLNQVKDKLDAATHSVAAASAKVEQFTSQGQACLVKLRSATALPDLSRGEQNVSKQVDCINQAIANLNNQTVGIQIAQIMSGLTGGIILPASIKTDAQRAIVTRILTGVQKQADAIAKSAGSIVGKPIAFVSNARPNIMQAVLLYWQSILPAVGTAIAIDLLPVILLIFIVLRRRDAEALGKNTSTTTLADAERIQEEIERLERSKRKTANNSGKA